MQAIRKALKDVQRGVPVSEGRMSVIPLLNESAGEATYLTLEAAVKRGGFTVEELSESGSVQELRVKNGESLPVFVLDGEQLLGAKQNRIVNLSLMVPAESELIIPVTCVERGRWSDRHDRSRPSENVMYAEVRASKMDHVTASMQRGPTVRHKRANQSAVWSDIRRKSARMQSYSSTEAMETVFSDHKSRLETFVERFTPVQHQVGAIFLVRNVETGVELFDSVSTCSTYMSQLVKSWAMDAIDGLRVEQLARRETTSIIDELCSASWKVSPALGLGLDARRSKNNLTAGALLVGNYPVHVAAFSRS
jgi:hypothetical protein